MGFGLCDAPATFEALMTHTLAAHRVPPLLFLAPGRHHHFLPNPGGTHHASLSSAGKLDGTTAVLQRRKVCGSNLARGTPGTCSGERNGPPRPDQAGGSTRLPSTNLAPPSAAVSGSARIFPTHCQALHPTQQDTGTTVDEIDRPGQCELQTRQLGDTTSLGGDCLQLSQAYHHWKVALLLALDLEEKSEPQWRG